MSLQDKHCVPCEGGTQPLTPEEFSVYLPQVLHWNVVDALRLEREFVCKDFVHAIRFIDRIAEIAEHEGHHPDLHLHHYKKVTVTLSTHAIGGLSVNDFILAVKIDALPGF